MTIQPDRKLTEDEYLAIERGSAVKQTDGRWLLAETESVADSIVLRSIDCRLALAEIYAKVRFDEAR